MPFLSTHKMAILYKTVVFFFSFFFFVSALVTLRVRVFFCRPFGKVMWRGTQQKQTISHQMIQTVCVGPSLITFFRLKVCFKKRYMLKTNGIQTCVFFNFNSIIFCVKLFSLSSTFYCFQINCPFFNQIYSGSPYFPFSFSGSNQNFFVDEE